MTGANSAFESGSKTRVGPSPPQVAECLSHAIRFQTISYDDPTRLDRKAFAGLHALLQTAYPRLHTTLTRQTISDISLLYTWTGADASLEPLMLLAHQDVVPAQDTAGWKYPPFSGQIAEGAVWGRGAIDVKGPLIAICQAVEQLIGQGFKPRRTIYLAFGHDEEVGGLDGAAAIGELLGRHGVRPLLISDEGGAIVEGMVPGVRKPVALVGIAEKGYLTLELKVTALGGHASMPPASSAIGILNGAIRILENHPFPARVGQVTGQMLRALAGELPFASRLAARYLRLCEPLVRRRLAATPAGAASLRTTTAVTMLRAGVKDNILPQNAVATVNCRIAPGESSQTVIERVKKIISDDRVAVSRAGRFHSEPSPVAPVDSPGFQLVSQTINQIAPDAVVAPFLVLGGTDSRHYTRLTPCVLRFSAIRVSQADLNTIHANNEHLTFENCRLLVDFYVRLISNAG